jgi:hypothetical protein
LNRAAGRCRAREGHRPKKEGGLDKWGPPVGGRRKGGNALSGLSIAGPWPNSGAGPIGPSGLLFFS